MKKVVKHAKKSIAGEVVSGFVQFLTSKTVLAMAVGLIVADTVKQIVAVLVDGLIRPLIGLFLASGSGTEFAPLNIQVGGVVFRFGDLLSVLLQAFIVFAVLYIVFVKILKKQDVLK